MSPLLWGNPIAWLGALAVAVPILVHLLATRRARRLPFPTLRFLPEAPPTAMRARRIEDALLLALRCAIVLAAVAALAQPWLALPGRDGGGGQLPLAIVVDTGVSMERAATGLTGLDGAYVPAYSGMSALELVRAEAAGWVDERSRTTVIEAEKLAAGIAAARMWLAAEGGAGERGEVALVSDFQAGALRAADVDALPAAIGVRLLPVEVVADARVELPALDEGERIWRPEATVAGGEMAVRWLATTPESDTPDAAPAPPSVVLLAADGDRDAAQAAAAAAARVVAVPRSVVVPGGVPRSVAEAVDVPRPAAGTSAVPGEVGEVTVVWPGAAQRSRLLDGASSPDRPWMADVLAALPDDVARTAAAFDGRLILFPELTPDSLASAEVLAALRRAAAIPIDRLDELEPGFLDGATLASWQRAPDPAPAAAGNDGRWLWLAALGLLLVEHGVRRRPSRASGGVAHE